MLTFDNDFLPAAEDLMEADLNGRAAGKLFTVIEAASLDELREFRGGLPAPRTEPAAAHQHLR